jgi:hypothetical protein
LVAALRDSNSVDPLKLSAPDGESLDYILSGVKANTAGRTCRNLVFDALRAFWKDGAASAETILDWTEASRR